MIDLIVRVVEGVGYLPIVTVDEKEVYRGEYQPSPMEALDKAFNAAERVRDE